MIISLDAWNFDFFVASYDFFAHVSFEFKWVVILVSHVCELSVVVTALCQHFFLFIHECDLLYIEYNNYNIGFLTSSPS